MAPQAANGVLVCVECGHPLSSVYKEYSRGNIRLSRCRKCRAIGDKYVEFESILLLIDMMLHRLSVYRHLLINRLHIGGDKQNSRRLPNAWKVMIVFLALEVYTRLYVTTLDRYSPSLYLWQTTAATPNAPRPQLVGMNVNGSVYSAQFQIDLLSQHSSLRHHILTSRKEFQTALTQWNRQHEHQHVHAGMQMQDDVWQEHLKCAGAACSIRFTRRQPDNTAATGGTNPDYVALLQQEEHEVPNVADIGDAVWQLPGLPSLMACCLLAGCAEMAAYLCGVFLAVKWAGTLATSRIRVDPATGLTRIQPPRSRRSMANAEALGIPAALPVDIGALPPPAPIVSQDASNIRIRRSISTGNTQAAEEIRNEMLTVERERALHATPATPEDARRKHRDAEESVVEINPDKAYSLCGWLCAQPWVASLGLTPAFTPARGVIDPSPPTHAEYSKIAHTVLIASFLKVFVTLSMVWNYPVSFLYMLSFFTFTSHATAIQAVCDCTIADSAFVVIFGYLCSLAMRLALYSVGVVEKLTLF